MSQQLTNRHLPAPTGHQPSGQPAEEGVETHQKHFNYLQLLCLAVGAQYTSVVAGRGTGKTLGVLAPKLHRLLEKLPRSSIVLIGQTYVQLVTTTTNELMAGMRNLGYVDNEDFWVRRFPPKRLGLKLPYNAPLDPKHTIFFRNPGSDSVSAVRLVSQDRPGSANGISVSAILGDEAKLLDKHKLDSEIMAINRGGQEHYGDIAEHHSVTFTTDMPGSLADKWILQDRQESLKPHHQRAIELILAIQLALYQERLLLKTRQRNTARVRRIHSYERQLNELRRGLVHFASASSFANVHKLGLQYFRTALRKDKTTFKRAYLNIEPDNAEKGFYPGLDTLVHCYDAVDYGFVDARAFTKYSFNDCRKDTDLDHGQPLTIGMDYGASFNCMSVGQRLSKLHPMNHSGVDEVRHLKAFHVEHPGLVQEVVAQFVAYYQYYYRKEVVYVYDPTAVWKNGLSPMTYADEVIKALKAAGWKVTKKFLSQVPPHHQRYLAWGVALAEDDTRLARQRFNRENMRLPIQAMKDAGVKEGKNGFEKDKKDEGTAIEQWKATHYTDAVDTVFWYLSIVVPGRPQSLTTLFGSQ